MNMEWTWIFGSTCWYSRFSETPTTLRYIKLAIYLPSKSAWYPYTCNFLGCKKIVVPPKKRIFFPKETAIFFLTGRKLQVDYFFSQPIQEMIRSHPRWALGRCFEPRPSRREGATAPRSTGRCWLEATLADIYIYSSGGRRIILAGAYNVYVYIYIYCLFIDIDRWIDCYIYR